MHIPITPTAVLLAVMQQAEADLKSAHAEICKLQGLDPEKHDWPQWSSQANTLRWFKAIRDTFDPERSVAPTPIWPVAAVHGQSTGGEKA